MNISHTEGQSYLSFCLLINLPLWAIFLELFTTQEWNCLQYKREGISSQCFPPSSPTPTTFWTVFFQKQQEGDCLCSLRCTSAVSAVANRVQPVRCQFWGLFWHHIQGGYMQWVRRKDGTSKQWQLSLTHSTWEHCTIEWALPLSQDHCGAIETYMVSVIHTSPGL